MKKYDFNNVINDKRVINAMERFNKVLNNDYGEFVSLDISKNNLYLIYENNDDSEVLQYDMLLSKFQGLRAKENSKHFNNRLQLLEYAVKIVIIDDWLIERHFNLDEERLSDFVILVDNKQDEYHCDLVKAFKLAMKECGIHVD